MYYSSIGIIALLILILNNFFILTQSSNKELNIAHKAYKIFLFGVAVFYLFDIIWGPLYTLKLVRINYINTYIYFLAMAISVLLWTKYIIIYTNDNNAFSRFIIIAGQTFLIIEIIILIINIFFPIAFSFDADGTYHSYIARNITLIFQIFMFLIINFYMLFIASRYEGNIKRRHIAIGIFCSFMVIFISLQVFYPLMPFYSIGYMLGTCLLHTFVLENENQARRKQLESILKVEKIQEFELGTTRKLAYSDSLTGVKNKMAYIEDIGGIDKRIEDNFLSNFGVIVFDLNNLKTINDTKGHDAGDTYIKNASSLICDKFKHSPVYRIGGDEFVVFLSGEDYRNRIKLLKDFSNMMEENTKKDEIVISFGFAAYQPAKDKSFLNLFNRADKKMYKHKQFLKSIQKLS